MYMDQVGFASADTTSPEMNAWLFSFLRMRHLMFMDLGGFANEVIRELEISVRRFNLNNIEITASTSTIDGDFNG